MQKLFKDTVALQKKLCQVFVVAFKLVVDLLLPGQFLAMIRSLGKKRVLTVCGEDMAPHGKKPLTRAYTL